MPRISREAAAAKESFVLGLFAENPSITMKEVQTKVKEKFGASMNANKIGQLRDSVTGKAGSPIVATEQPAVETATTEVSAGNENISFTSVPAPPPVSVAPVVEAVTPVVTPVVQVTDSTGTYVRPVTETPAQTEVAIRPGLVEVVKTETQV